ncbi:MAG: acyltransferase family protein [Geminicoccaceae bacterium]
MTEGQSTFENHQAVPFRHDGSHIHSLNGLRAVSIFIVIASHYTRIGAIPSGFGVSIFFVISGFLITRLLLGDMERTGSISLPAFYWRRFFRLFPAILTGIVVALGVQELTGHDWVTVDRVIASLFFFQNYWGIAYPFTGPLGVHWSLSIEEHFYLVFPIALVVFHRRLGVGFVSILLMICLAVLLLRGWSVSTFDDIEIAKSTIYKATHYRIDTILAGCILALMAHHESTRAMLQRIVAQYPITLGLAVLIAGHTLNGETEIAIKHTTQAVGITLIIAGVLFSDRCEFPRWALNLPIAVWIGRLSFSLYLLHMQADHLAAHFLPWGPHDWPTLPIAVALAVLMSWACYAWIEQPMIKAGKKLRASPRLAAVF